MDDNQLDKENPEYNKIRHFKSTWKDYVDFWEKKGARMTPWKEWDQKYPSTAKMKKTDIVHSYKTFNDESIKESNDGPDLANINVKKLSKNSLKLKAGDQVVWRDNQVLGVGTLNMIHPDGTANVQFYDTLQGSTVGKQGDDYKIPIKDLFAVDALADSYQFNESYDNIKVKQSAGIAIVFGSKVLIGHATGKPSHTAYTIPKGGIDKGETILQAALRETYEEVGIKVPKKLIPSTYKTVSYVKSKKARYPKDAPIGTHWKDVHYYIVQIDSLDQIGLKDEIIAKSNLQLEEIDWAGFVPIKDALKKISPVMKPIIKSLMIYSNNNFKTFESFKSELNEDNPVSLAGSQQDHVPMNKPFVIKSKKQRKGSNEDEDDETQEVANMNTASTGAK